MAVHVDDDLQRLFPSWYIGPSNRRGLIWLWLTLHTSGLSRTLGPFDGGVNLPLNDVVLSSG